MVCKSLRIIGNCSFWKSLQNYHWSDVKQEKTGTEQVDSCHSGNKDCERRVEGFDSGRGDENGRVADDTDKRDLKIMLRDSEVIFNDSEAEPSRNFEFCQMIATYRYQ